MLGPLNIKAHKLLRFMKNLRILQSSSFIKAYVFYLFEFSLDNKTKQM